VLRTRTPRIAIQNATRNGILFNCIFYADVLQSRLTYTVIRSANSGVTIKGLAPLLDHVTVTECGGTAIAYTHGGWGLLTMLECNVSRNSYSSLSVESSAASVYLYGSVHSFLGCVPKCHHVNCNCSTD